MPTEILDRRAQQIQDWLDNGHISLETLVQIQAIWNDASDDE